jgi:hypothetical protein
MRTIKKQHGSPKNQLFGEQSGLPSKLEPFARRRQFVAKAANAKQMVAHAIQSDAGMRWPRACRAPARSLSTETVVPDVIAKQRSQRAIAASSKARTLHAAPPGYDTAVLDATAMDVEHERRNPLRGAAPATQDNASLSPQAAHPNDPPPSYEEAIGGGAMGKGMQDFRQKLGQQLAASKTNSEEASTSASIESEDSPTGTFVVNTSVTKAGVSPKKREDFLGEDDSNPQLLHGSDYEKNAEEYRFVPLPADWHIQQAPKDPARVNVKLTNKLEDGTSAPSMPTDVYYNNYPSALTGTVGNAFANLAGQAANLFQSIFRTVKTAGDTANQLPKLDASSLGTASNYAPAPSPDTNIRVAANTSSVK